jgi:hypothetical protein
MAESNQVTLNKASIPGGEVVAADTIAAKQYQLIKLILGAAGVNSGPVSATNPLPTGDAAAAAALASILAKLSADPSTSAGVTAAANAIVAQIAANLAGTQPVSAAALPLPAGAATQATLADILAKLIAAPATAAAQATAQDKLDLIEAVLSAWTFIGGVPLVTQADISLNTPMYQRSAINVLGNAATRISFIPTTNVDTLLVQVFPHTVELEGSLPADMCLMMFINGESAAASYTLMNGGVVPDSPTAEAGGLLIYRVTKEDIRLPWNETIRSIDICAAKTVSAAIMPLDVIMWGYKRA